MHYVNTLVALVEAFIYFLLGVTNNSCNIY